MNIYLLCEDGENFCIRALTMAEAIIIAKNKYFEELKEETKEFNLEEETDYYDNEVLLSCSLVGKLKN